MRLRHGILNLLLFTLPLVATGCSSEPRYVSCRIDSECRELGGKYHYCMMNRCVECVGSARCGFGFTCRDGSCQAKQ